MSTLNLEEFPVERPQSKLPLILRTIAIAVLGTASLAGAGLGGYYYSKYQQTELKIDAIALQLETLRKDVESIKSDVSGAFGVNNKQDDLESEIKKASDKLDEIGNDVESIKADVNSIESNVSSIESDVSSIQLKIGY